MLHQVEVVVLAGFTITTLQPEHRVVGNQGRGVYPSRGEDEEHVGVLIEHLVTFIGEVDVPDRPGVGADGSGVRLQIAVTLAGRTGESRFVGDDSDHRAEVITGARALKRGPEQHRVVAGLTEVGQRNVNQALLGVVFEVALHHVRSVGSRNCVGCNVGRNGVSLNLEDRHLDTGDGDFQFGVPVGGVGWGGCRQGEHLRHGEGVTNYGGTGELEGDEVLEVRIRQDQVPQYRDRSGIIGDGERDNPVGEGDGCFPRCHHQRVVGGTLTIEEEHPEGLPGSNSDVNVGQACVGVVQHHLDVLDGGIRSDVQLGVRHQVSGVQDGVTRVVHELGFSALQTLEPRIHSVQDFLILLVVAASPKRLYFQVSKSLT